MSSIFEMQTAQVQLDILEQLAKIVQRKNCRFLEIGSWLGDSTMRLGKVAKSQNGHLFCIDWWRGNADTKLEEVAKSHDVFSIFWDRVQANDLQETVIPIRGNSNDVHKILKETSFDLIFIDGDHFYKGVVDDIKNYRPLVRKNGIICGHDCEGFISDYEKEFLYEGMASDYYQTVHCGVVLAVAESLKEYSIFQSIWAARKGSWNRWKKISLKNANPSKQLTPPPLGHSKSYFIYRVKKRLYAISKDVPFELPLKNEEELCYDSTLEALSDKIAEKINVVDLNKSEPDQNSISLIFDIFDYNIVSYQQSYYAVAQQLGPAHLPDILADSQKCKKLYAQKYMLCSSNFPELIQIINKMQKDKQES